MKHKKTALTLDSFVNNEWLPAIQRQRMSWVVDRNISRKYILPVLGEMPLTKIGANDILRFLKMCRKDGKPASTRNRILSVLRSIFLVAAKNEHINASDSPVANISNEPAPLKRPVALEAEDVKNIIGALEKSGAKEAKFLHLLLLTNAGKADLLKARWDNYSKANHALTLSKETAAGIRSKRIQLSPKAVEIIESLPRQKGCPWMFPGAKPCAPMTDVYYFWKKLRKDCGFPSLTLRDLTVNLVLDQIRGGVHMGVLNEIFGYGFSRQIRRMAAEA